MERVGTVDEEAKTVAFLASEVSSFSKGAKTSPQSVLYKSFFIVVRWLQKALFISLQDYYLEGLE